MVTFSIPGEGDMTEAGRSTPRPVPSLPFASRAGYVPSPVRNNKRLGTPQSVPSRKHLLTRDALPTSSLSRSQIASNRNIFRQSSITNSPPHIPFSPSLSQSTATKVFAPGATPEPSRGYRESTAKATPRGMASRATDKELFKLRIEDPDPELSGEVLTNKIPKQWSSTSSIYADQYLKHLCPADFDDEQRRQFFCILDLRRLKYAANDIFSRKDWKLNVINFAKEFEKSRSIILLRYGLYEFQNIKPSKDIIKRWRREHGLPDPEEEEVEATPTKASSKKRKAEGDELPKDSGLANNNNKRRAAVQDEEEATPVAAPAPKKNKRKASLSDEAETQPSKKQNATPSASKSLFEKITNNKSSTPAGSPLKNFTKPAEESNTPKANPFTANKVNGTSLSRSVFQTLKPASAQAGNNIFGYLSDASSAKNSVADDDGEGSDSDAEGSEEPSAVASAAETASQVDSSAPFGQPAANAGTGESSAPGTRESTPGRSLFDRVTKNSAGEPIRMDEPAEESSPEKPEAKPLDQTWNPSSTPLKFAPPTSAPQTNSLFANTTSAPSTNIFGAKPSTSSNIFGTKQDKPVEKESPAATTVDLKDKSGSESDKENENDEAPKKNLFETKAPPLQTSNPLFPLKPASETPKPAEPTKSLFAAPKQDVKPAEPTEPKANGLSTEPAKSLFGASAPAAKPAPVTNLFGSSKPAESSTPVLQSSTLFGAKSAEAPKPATSLFGASSTPASGASTPAPATNLFGAKPATTVTTNIFGGASSTPAATPAPKSLFGGSFEAPKADAAPVSSGFSFTSTGSNEAAKPLFAAPKSPTTSAPMFGGSPMKQDGPSPAKKAFNGGSSAAAPAPIFNLSGGNTSSTSAPPIFGGVSGASAAPTNGASSFGAASTNSGSGGSFSFGAGASFNNPFASGSGNNVDKANAGSNSNSGGMFNFGATPSTSTFQFGGASTSSAPAPVFGANSGSAPSFGSTTSAGTAPTFSFTAGTSQPQASAPTFGTQAAPNMFNLQPPAGGASTGTSKSPMPKPRKILPLKRRV